MVEPIPRTSSGPASAPVALPPDSTVTAALTDASRAIVVARTDRSPGIDPAAALLTDLRAKVVRSDTPVVGSGLPYRLQLAVPGVASLLDFLADGPLPVGSTVSIEAIEPGRFELRTVRGSQTSARDSTSRAPTSATFDLASSLRAAGWNARPETLTLLTQIAETEHLPIESAARAAIELWRRGTPIRADLLRAGVAWWTGAADAVPEPSRLVDLIEASVAPGPERDRLLASLRALGRPDSRSPAADAYAHQLRVALAAATDLLWRDDPFLTEVDRVLAQLHGGSSDAAAGGRSTPRELLALLESRAPGWRELATTTRAKAIELLTRLERDALRQSPIFREFQSVARELQRFVEAQSFVQYLDRTPTALEGNLLASHHGWWTTPEGRWPVRYTIVDRRPKGSGDSEPRRLGFRLDFETRQLGEISIDGEWTAADSTLGDASADAGGPYGGGAGASNDTGSSNGRLELGLRAELDGTRATIERTLGRLIERLEGEGYRPIASLRPWSLRPRFAPIEERDRVLATRTHSAPHLDREA